MNAAPARCDVAVVGGGPAGVAAAVTLARSGRDVVLVDKATFPRDKCCGDGVTTAAWRRYRELGLRPGTVATWHGVDTAVLRSPSGRLHHLPLPATAIARRADLDAAFVDVARGAGVKVHDGHALLAARADGDAVVLDVAGLGPLAAHYAIGADGMWSPLRKALAATAPEHQGVPGAAYLGNWQAVRQYFRAVSPEAGRAMRVWFEPDVVPGYVWSFPLPGGRANVGVGVLRANGARGPTRDVWPDVLARPHIAEVLGARATPEAPHRAWPIPCQADERLLSAVGGRVLFAGDAARLADPMTGEGIGQALESGTAAAMAILRTGPATPAGAARRYASAISRGLVLDNRLAGALSKVLASPQRSERVLRLAGLTPWTRRHFARWLLEDYPRAVVATPWRWVSDHA